MLAEIGIMIGFLIWTKTLPAIVDKNHISVKLSAVITLVVSVIVTIDLFAKIVN